MIPTPFSAYPQSTTLEMPSVRKYQRLEVRGRGVVNSQRYSSVLVKFTVYTRRMQADKLALEDRRYQ
jgi:hypothetical protein